MARPTCPKCGHQAAADAAACPDCGHEMTNGAAAEEGSGPARNASQPVEATGWAIGNGEDTSHKRDAADLYRKLDEVVLPLWYDDRTRWIWMMKQSISKLGAYFNSTRMMRRYASGDRRNARTRVRSDSMARGW